jgi:hypothetical protein
MSRTKHKTHKLSHDEPRPDKIYKRLNKQLILKEYELV